MRTLDMKTKKSLIGRSHKLSPVVMIGQKGLTEAVSLEIEAALLAHELIKIKIASRDRDLREQLFNEIAEASSAHLVTHIGMVGVFYRKNT